MNGNLKKRLRAVEDQVLGGEVGVTFEELQRLWHRFHAGTLTPLERLKWARLISTWLEYRKKLEEKAAQREALEATTPATPAESDPPAPPTCSSPVSTGGASDESAIAAQPKKEQPGALPPPPTDGRGTEDPPMTQREREEFDRLLGKSHWRIVNEEAKAGARSHARPIPQKIPWEDPDEPSVRSKIMAKPSADEILGIGEYAPKRRKSISGRAFNEAAAVTDVRGSALEEEVWGRNLLKVSLPQSRSPKPTPPDGVHPQETQPARLHHRPGSPTRWEPGWATPLQPRMGKVKTCSRPGEGR